MKKVIASRTFKTDWFAKAARKAGISDTDLCKAIAQVQLGQCDDLGGGVFKKRLQKNLYRSIIIAKGGKHWIYSFLFAKKDRSNITEEELKGFRELAGIYTRITQEEIELAKENGVLVEICHGKQV